MIPPDIVSSRIPPLVLLLVTVSLISRFKSSVGHDVGALIQVLRASSIVLSDTFEFFISLESIVNCDDVENYYS